MTATSTDRATAGCACGCAAASISASSRRSADELALIPAELAALRAKVARLAPDPLGRWRGSDRCRRTCWRAGAAERVALFPSLFVNRDDVYAQRWEKNGRKGWYLQLERLPGHT
ncbi:hypothetical protein NCC78_09865 [Micromonospora phytophila]|uniref:TOTE conflict system archaeo-eukaryotic primase domain-containing protein n=1 Tax=Micromonospora phytophila TaxID=709888 RepID=UPI00202DD1CC|nr:hypothetical protein [Micromonospora phytophila]MCM0674992.1 hypothetical protein [Micromonospora phytophila]